MPPLAVLVLLLAVVATRSPFGACERPDDDRGTDP
jgi:hypothetical protein